MKNLANLLLVAASLSLVGQKVMAETKECHRDDAVMFALQSRLPVPTDFEVQELRWTDELPKFDKLSAKDRHLFAVADRFGGSHELMNNLNQSVEVEYFFRKKNGVMRRGFAMAVMSEECSAVLTYMGLRPYDL